MAIFLIQNDNQKFMKTGLFTVQLYLDRQVCTNSVDTDQTVP